MSPSPPIPPEVIEQKIRSLGKEVDDAEEYLDRLRQELEWYVRGRRLFGDSVQNPATDPLPGIAEERETSDDTEIVGGEENGKPTLRDAILDVLGQEPRKTWQMEAVIEELRRHDWLPGGKNAEHHTRSKLAEMHRKGLARRMDRGRYRLPPGPKGEP